MEDGLKCILSVLWICNSLVLEKTKIAKMLVDGILGDKRGGGQYSEVGDGFKIGKWIELSDELNQFEYISFAVECKKDKKVGK
ncbi:unnamed protein product [Paramecium octaurelia]|uniref:Uncharacterized protein n=2 Tax=Paramecium octaurelia TaxID=43137 RepID=A0A8S1TR71_PAROT|nr:unnamed protein product [Paramecium octaurelia]CAD8153396.1 unnamed protein product [Paramecium octaurelia]